MARSSTGSSRRRFERDDRVDALLPHGEVGEPERLGGVLVFEQQLQPGLDPLEGLPAPLQGRLTRLLVQGHVGLRRSAWRSSIHAA